MTMHTEKLHNLTRRLFLFGNNARLPEIFKKEILSIGDELSFYQRETVESVVAQLIKLRAQRDELLEALRKAQS